MRSNESCRLSGGKRRRSWLFTLSGALCIGVPISMNAMAQPQPGQSEAQGGRFTGGGNQNQGGRRGGQGGFAGGQWWQTRDRLNQGEIDKMAKMLHFDEGQMAIASGMFSSFDQAYQQKVDASRDAFGKARQEIRESGDWASMMPKMLSLAQESEAEATQLEASFLSDIHETVLTDEQRVQWPSYEQARRRRATLVKGARIPGEGVDLFAIADEVSLTEQQRVGIAPTLSAYSVELDHALIERDQVVNDTMGRFDTIMKEADPKDFEEILRKGKEKRETIRNINTNYAQLIAAQLDGEAGREYLDAFHKKAYPRVYHDTDVDDYAAKVLAIDSLTEEQHRQISAVLDDYQSRMRDLNRQLADLDTKQQEERQARRFQGMQVMYSQGPEAARDQMRQRWQSYRTEQQQDQSTNPIHILREQKTDMESTTLDALVQALTPEQLEVAPRPQPEAERAKLQQEREKRIQQWRERGRQQQSRDDGGRG